MWAQESSGGRIAALTIAKSRLLFGWMVTVFLVCFCHSRGKEDHQACQDPLDIRWAWTSVCTAHINHLNWRKEHGANMVCFPLENRVCKALTQKCISSPLKRFLSLLFQHLCGLNSQIWISCSLFTFKIPSSAIRIQHRWRFQCTLFQGNCDWDPLIHTTRETLHGSGVICSQDHLSAPRENFSLALSLCTCLQCELFCSRTR